MISKPSWVVEYKKEIERAIQARSEGNEGRARVCARRAAGILIGEYLFRHGHTGISNSAYDRLALFTDLPEVEEMYKEVCRHFLLKVNRDHRLPQNTDLLKDVFWLKDNLLIDYTD